MDRFDAWLARQPEDYEVVCSECGEELSNEPALVVLHEETLQCSGEVITATEEYSNRAVEILGESFRGKTYTFAYTECGQFEGKHSPHNEVVNAYQVFTFLCPNGHTTQFNVP